MENYETIIIYIIGLFLIIITILFILGSIQINKNYNEYKSNVLLIEDQYESLSQRSLPTKASTAIVDKNMSLEFAFFKPWTNPKNNAVFMLNMSGVKPVSKASFGAIAQIDSGGNVSSSVFYSQGILYDGIYSISYDIAKSTLKVKLDPNRLKKTDEIGSQYILTQSQLSNNK